MPLQYKTVAPVGERVLVKVDVGDEKSAGGILLPSSAQKKPTQGHIEAAGTAKAVRVRQKPLNQQKCRSRGMCMQERHLLEGALAACLRASCSILASLLQKSHPKACRAA